MGLENDIKMDIREVEWSGMHWINVSQDSAQWQTQVEKLLNR
jgi:hypothetical protein